MKLPTDPAPTPITSLGDQRRESLAGAMQYGQDLLHSVQRHFPAESLAFKAIRLAWEAVRLAWYAVRDETDGDHLEDVKTQLRHVEEHLKRKENGL
jgi:hypothetical protein